MQTANKRSSIKDDLRTWRTYFSGWWDPNRKDDKKFLPYTWSKIGHWTFLSPPPHCLLMGEEEALIWCQYNIRIIPRPQTNEILAHAHRTWRQNRIGLCRDLTQILYWCQIRKSHGLAGTEFERKKCQDENQNKMRPQPTESPTNKSKQIWTPWKGTKRGNPW